jgi:hypothetical protein
MSLAALKEPEQDAYTGNKLDYFKDLMISFDDEVKVAYDHPNLYGGDCSTWSKGLNQIRLSLAHIESAIEDLQDRLQDRRDFDE